MQEDPPGPGRRPRPTGLIVAVAVLATMLVAAAGTALVRTQQRQIDELRGDVAELGRALADERAAEADDPERAWPDGEDLQRLDDLLEGLLGEGGLGGLFGEGGLADLFGDLEIDEALLSCLQPAVSVDAVPGIGAADQLPEIADRVEVLRELEFPESVEARFLPPEVFAAELRARVAADLDRDAAEVERRRLVALGAIPPEADLVELQLDLVSGQAAAFYDPDRGEIVVRVDDAEAPLSPAEQVTLVHELEHALADAVHGLPLGATEPGDGDAALATLALVEGSATVLMQQYAAAVFDLGDQLLLGLDPQLLEAQAQLDAFPHHLRRELLFPYTEGLAFACALLHDGGWAAVDDAFSDLPATTSQILWPQRYRAGEAAIPPPAPDPPAGWGEGSADTFGAAELAWLLEAPGGDTAAALDDPLDRAAAWAGGSVYTWPRGDDTAVALRLVDGGGGPSLCPTIADWYEAAFPDAQGAPTEAGEEGAWTGSGRAAVLTCPGDVVALGIGTDVELARALSN